MGSATPAANTETGSTRSRGGPARLLLAALAVLLVGLAVPLVGCGGGDSTSASSTSSAGSAAASGGAKAVTIQDYMFKPASITVPVGTTVKFTNRDSTPHTATSKESGAFESGPIDTGKTGEITLKKAGTFAYYCAFHPFMKGTITVK
ncbi:MAG TPA: cupredoxin family copper-binding protein [Solirubrobacterales bacterium]|jgi:plastocyanin|nr:cupredoxin family copper-binding protein [Solirubrobacterales bacterium]